MPLFDAKTKPVRKSVTYSNEIAAKIQQRRYQMLVHSLLYYELDTNLVSDAKWAEWAAELVQLQKEHPDIAEEVIFADAFRNFDGSTGFDLPFRDEQIVNIAGRLLRSNQGPESQEALRRLMGVQTTPAEYKGFRDMHHNKTVKPASQTQRKVVKKDEPVKRKKLF